MPKIVPLLFLGLCGSVMSIPHGIYINCTTPEYFYWMMFSDLPMLTGTFDLGATSNKQSLYDGSGIPYKYNESNPSVITLDQSSPVLDAFLKKYHLNKDEWKELKYNHGKGLVIITVNGTEIVHYHD